MPSINAQTLGGYWLDCCMFFIAHMACGLVVADFTGLPSVHLQLQSPEPVSMIPTQSPDERRTYVFTEDYRHDVYDTTIGSIIGAMVAIYSYVRGLPQTQIPLPSHAPQYAHTNSFSIEEIFPTLDIAGCGYSIPFENWWRDTRRRVWGTELAGPGARECPTFWWPIRGSGCGGFAVFEGKQNSEVPVIKMIVTSLDASF